MKVNKMATPLDLDQLQTFCAIADCKSFTKAAKRVFKTQSAVSMQIKRLEERLDKSLFIREGRLIKLTSDGETLYAMARHMLRINAEIIDIFSQETLAGNIRFGVPDDYAVKMLPIILSSFQRTHPKISVDVKCMASEDLLKGMKEGRFDLIIFSQGTMDEFGELFRVEKIHWVVEQKEEALKVEPIPIASGPQTCLWRANAIEGLNRVGKNYRIAYTSSDATAISSAVMAGLAIGFLPQSAIQKGMKIVDKDIKLPPLLDAQIAILRASHAYGGIYDALAKHIVDEMGNL